MTLRVPDVLVLIATLGLGIAAVGCEASAPDPGTPAAHAEPDADPQPNTQSEPAPGATSAPDTPKEDTALDSIAAADAAYAKLLADVVTDKGLVRYDRLAERWRDELGAIVAAYAKSTLPTDDKTRLAFWCNAYNANVLQQAMTASRRAGFSNVLGEAGFFDKRLISVGNEQLTLNDLENERVRKIGDARIHAALVCAAMSCPPLRAEPYQANRLDEQFDDQSRRWVRHPAKFTVAASAGAGDRLGASAILDWYAADFNAPPYGSATGFVLAFADPAGDVAKLIVRQGGTPTIEWLTYDWSLNDAGP